MRRRTSQMNGRLSGNGDRIRLTGLLAVQRCRGRSEKFRPRFQFRRVDSLRHLEEKIAVTYTEPLNQMTRIRSDQMRKRIRRTGIALVCILALQGCPSGESQFIGTWSLTVNNLTRGLELMPGGQATSFTLDSSLAGSLSWFVRDGQFFLNQDTGTNEIVFSGRLAPDGTTISGGAVAWAGPAAGAGNPWSAVRI